MPQALNIVDWLLRMISRAGQGRIVKLFNDVEVR
jgi:hypothetical protein